MTRDDRSKEQRAEPHAGQAGDANGAGHAHGHASHGHGHASHDHTHHAGHGHKFDPAKIARLDNPERRKLLPPKTIVRLVSPFAGMSFADIGAGTGFALFPVVEALEGRGRFYGLDCQDAINEVLRERAIHHRFGESIIPVLTAETHIDLGPETQDVVLCMAVYHEFPARDHHLAEMLRVLKPGGRVVIIDWMPTDGDVDADFGPPNAIRVSVEDVCRELAAAGFVQIATHDDFKHHWCVTASRRH